MNGNVSLEGLSEKAFEIARRRQAAASEVVAMLEEQFETAFASHAGTALHAAAWLAGSSLRRSFGPDGHAATDSEAATQKLEEEMKLMKVFMYLVDKDGIQLKPEEYADEIPAEHRPHITIRQVEEQFGGRYDEIMRKYGFDHAEGAKTGAVACARLVKLHCLNRKDLEPRIAASIVSKGFVENARGSGEA